MRIEIVEIGDPARPPGRQSRCAEIARLHNDHDRLRNQRPAPRGKSQPLTYAELLNSWNKLGTPDRDPPAVVTTVPVDGEHAAEWRLQQRQPTRSGQIAELADEIVGRFTWPWPADGDDKWQAIGADIEHPGFRIDRSTSPVAAAGNAWPLEGPPVER